MAWLIPVFIVGFVVFIIIALVVETVKQNKRWAEQRAQNFATCEKVWSERLEEIREALLNHGLSQRFVDKCTTPEAYLQAVRDYCPQGHLLTVREDSLEKEQEMIERDTGLRLDGKVLTYEYNKYNTYVSIYRDFQSKVVKHCCPSCDYVRDSKLRVFCTVDKEDGSTRAVHSINDAWHDMETFAIPSASVYFPQSFHTIFDSNVSNTLFGKVQGALKSK